MTREIPWKPVVGGIIGAVIGGILFLLATTAWDLHWKVNQLWSLEIQRAQAAQGSQMPQVAPLPPGSASP